MAQLDVQQVIDQYFERIHRAALVLTGNPWDADDLAQETFLVLATRSHRFEARSSLYTWLYGILLNLERRRQRRNGVARRKLRVLHENGAAQQRETAASFAPLEVSEWKKSLWALVNRLPDGQRQALVLRFSEHLRYDEIAEALDCPLGTVKSRIYHGLANLRTMLAGEQTDIEQVPPHAWEDLNHAV